MVDSWAQNKSPKALETRLITKEELVEELDCDDGTCNNSPYAWIYSSDYSYYTKTPKDGLLPYICSIGKKGQIGCGDTFSYIKVVRPVIVLSKTVLK